MAEENTKPEGPADVGEPCDEGGKVKPDEDPSARNMSGKFPGEANEEAIQEAKEVKTGAKEEIETNKEAGEARAGVKAQAGSQTQASTSEASS